MQETILELYGKLVKHDDRFYALVSVKDNHGNIRGQKIPIVQWEESE